MSQPCRILHLIDHLRLGGAQRALLDLILASDATLFAHEVACLHGTGVEWKVFQQAGVRLYSLSAKKWNPVYLIRLAVLLCSGRYDAIHCHLFYSNIIGKPLAAMLGTRLRFCHDQWNDPPPTKCAWMRVLDRLAHRFTTHVFAVSPFISEYLIQVQRLSPEQVSVVPNGIDLQRFPASHESVAEVRNAYNLPQNGQIVGAVARLTAQKNLSLFLRIAARVIQRFPETTFVVAGTGEDEAALKLEAKQLGLDGKCYFLGHVTDMPRLYPTFDVFVLPSVYEGFGLVIIEALLCGVAVVATDVAGAKAYLRNEKDCYFVSPTDKEEFIHRITQLLENPGLRASQAHSARNIIVTELTSTIMAREVERVYQYYHSELHDC